MSEKHSGPGIASFVMSLLATLSMFVLFVAAGFMASRPGLNPQSPELIILGLAIIGMGMILFVAFVLGIVGLFQSERNKLFAIFGTALSAIVFFGTVALIIIGNMIKQPGA